MFPNESVLSCIGNTPLLKFRTRFEGQDYQLHAKLEFMNPSGSIKDRIAKYMVEQAEAKGLLKPGFAIVEATSGNTGIALSMVAAAKRYKMLVVMPEHMTGERIKMMTNLGADVCLTPRSDGFEGAVARAEMIAESGEHYFDRSVQEPREYDGALQHDRQGDSSTSKRRCRRIRGRCRYWRNIDGSW